jgi:hypothetical protein
VTKSFAFPEESRKRKSLGEEKYLVSMAENETEVAADSSGIGESPAQPAEEITYHAVEKDGQVTAIWEMQGRKHLRTIDPRSRQGQEILRLYTTEHHEDEAAS